MNRLFELGTKMTPRGLARLAKDAVFVEGKGSFMYDTAGKKYLDFSCGIGVTSTGKLFGGIIQVTVIQK